MQSFLVIAILVVATLGAGGLYPGIFPLCAIAAVAGLFVTMPVRYRANRLFWLAGMLVLGWVFFTAAPLPASWVSSLNPARAKYFAQADEATWRIRALQDFQSAGNNAPASLADKGNATLPVPSLQAEDDDCSALQGDKNHCFSLNRDGTLRFFLLAAACWGMFWMAAGLGHVARRRMLKNLVILGAIVALVGISTRGSGWAANVLPRQTLEECGISTSIWPFVNRNHFATFCALLAPAALCLILSPVLGVRLRHPQGGEPVASPWQLPASVLERVIYSAAFAVLVVSAMLSESRGGLLALLLSVLVTVLYWVKGRQLAASTVATILGIGVLFTVVFLPSESFQHRVGTLSASNLTLSDGRLEIWQSGIAVWKEFPVIGAGMDGFRTASAMHKVGSALESPVYTHNEYVQLLADGGIAGFLIFLAAAVIYFWGFAAYRLSPERYAPDSGDKTWGAEKLQARPLKAAVLGAGTVLLLHSCFDFPCRIPLNALLAATLLGLGFAQKGTAPSHGPESSAPAVWKYAAVLAALLLFGASLYAANEIGDRHRQNDYVPHLQRATIQELAAAVESAPTYWVGWHEMGRRAFDIAQGRISQDKAFPHDSPPQAGWLRQQLDFWLSKQAEGGVTAADTPAPKPFTTTPPSAKPSAAKGGAAPVMAGIESALSPAPLTATTPDSTTAGALLQNSRPLPVISQKAWMDFGLYCFRRATECNPDDYRVWLSLGMAEGQAGNLAEAQEAFDHVIELDPSQKPETEKAMRAFTAAKQEGTP